MMRIWTMMAMGLALAAPAAAQTGDANMRHPGLLQIGGEGGQLELVIGDSGWGDVLTTLGTFQGSSDERSAEIIALILDGRDLNSPIFLFELARRTVATDPDRALDAYFLGRSRAIYDAARCVDPTALDVITVTAGMAGPQLTALLRTDTARVAAALERVIQSGDAFTSQASPWWACSYGDSAYLAAVNQADMPGSEWLKVETVWPSLRAAITNNMNANLARLRAGPSAAQ